MRVGDYKMLANMLPQPEISIRDTRPPSGVSIMDFIRKSEIGNFALYDLRNDPNETENLWDSAAHVATRAALSERLNHHLIAQMDESPLSTRIA